jgi:hypothetical protein
VNRRKFLNWLGAGVAVGAVAPTALLSKEADLPNNWPSTWVPHDEVFQSPWVPGEYNDYVNFSSFAIATAMDESVTNAASELGKAHSRRIEELVRDVR